MVDVVVALAVDGRGTGTTGVAMEEEEADDVPDDAEEDEAEPPVMLNKPE